MHFNFANMNNYIIEFNYSGYSNYFKTNFTKFKIIILSYKQD